MEPATAQWIWSPGSVVRGHRVASGQGGDPRFPEGTIRPQLPLLLAQASALAEWLREPHPATINVRLAGRVSLGKPEVRTRPLAWTPLFPPETFLLSRCLLEHAGVRRPALLYVPDPATKPDHPQAPDIMEVLAPFIPALDYGDVVAIGRAGGLFDLA